MEEANTIGAWAKDYSLTTKNVYSIDTLLFSNLLENVWSDMQTLNVFKPEDSILAIRMFKKSIYKHGLFY